MRFTRPRAPAPRRRRGATPTARAGSRGSLWSARPRGARSTSRATASGADQLRERRARRVAALHLLAQRLAQPVVVRGEEAVPRPRASSGGSSSRHRPAVEPLARRARARAARGDPLDEPHQLHVEERHAQLEARGHRHLVVADQDAVGEEEVRVEVERLLEQAAIRHVAEHVLRPARAARPRPRRRAAGEQRAAQSSSVISTSRSRRSASRCRRAGGPPAGARVARQRAGRAATGRRARSAWPARPAAAAAWWRP